MQKDIINLQGNISFYMGALFIVVIPVTLAVISWMNFSHFREKDDPKKMSNLKSIGLGLCLGLVGALSAYFLKNDFFCRKIKNIPEMILESDLIQKTIKTIPSKVVESKFFKKVLKRAPSILSENLNFSERVEDIAEGLLNCATSPKAEKISYMAKFFPLAVIFAPITILSFVYSRFKNNLIAVGEALFIGLAAIILPRLVFENLADNLSCIIIKEVEKNTVQKIEDALCSALSQAGNQIIANLPRVIDIFKGVSR